MVQCYHLLFVWLIFNVFHIELLFYRYWPSQVEKLFISIVYCFYPFSVFWLTKVVPILFTNYSVIVKCFVPSSFIEYIILLLKLFVNSLKRLYFVKDTIVLFWKILSCYVISYWATSSLPFLHPFRLEQWNIFWW